MTDTNHPFVDGNKHTGITAAGVFLMLNAERLTANNAKLESFTLEVATSHPDVSMIGTWLQTHSERFENK